MILYYLFKLALIKIINANKNDVHKIINILQMKRKNGVKLIQ